MFIRLVFFILKNFDIKETDDRVGYSELEFANFFNASSERSLPPAKSIPRKG